MVIVKYLNNKGKESERNSATFDPERKAKIIGVLVPCLLRSSNETYRPIYDNYRNRLENHPVHAEKTKLHKHKMALRYVAKIFLLNLHVKWREIEGLPVSVPYSEAKLGMKHGEVA